MKLKNIILLFTLIYSSLCLSTSLYGQNSNMKETAEEVSTKNLKRKVAIGRFSNETKYGKSVFYNKDNDPMEKQAQDLLVSKLAAADKFLLLERSDMSKLDDEVNLSGRDMVERLGADYLIIGSITKYGRVTTGNSKMFKKTKTQAVEASVSIRIVDVYTGMIIFSDEGSGIATQSTKTVMGLGGRAGFDATLSDKAISAAIDNMVENIIVKCTDNPWRSYFLSVDDEATIISGGQSQGLQVGDKLLVKKRGKTVKNPQTGGMIELPGTVIGSVIINLTLGDTPETEISTVSYAGEELDTNNLSNYIIVEE